MKSIYFITYWVTINIISSSSVCWIKKLNRLHIAPGLPSPPDSWDRRQQHWHSGCVQNHLFVPNCLLPILRITCSYIVHSLAKLLKTSGHHSWQGRCIMGYIEWTTDVVNTDVQSGFGHDYKMAYMHYIVSRRRFWTQLKMENGWMNNSISGLSFAAGGSWSQRTAVAIRTNRRPEYCLWLSKWA